MMMCTLTKFEILILANIVLYFHIDGNRKGVLDITQETKFESYSINSEVMVKTWPPTHHLYSHT
jgi:hypothetical protein